MRASSRTQATGHDPRARRREFVARRMTFSAAELPDEASLRRMLRAFQALAQGGPPLGGVNRRENALRRAQGRYAGGPRGCQGVQPASAGLQYRLGERLPVHFARRTALLLLFAESPSQKLKPNFCRWNHGPTCPPQ
jgi:hypothetical protein